MFYILFLQLDNGESAAVKQVSELGSGDDFGVGTTEVAYVASDAAGNEQTCTFSVHVSDPWAPELQYCPSGWEVVVTVHPTHTILGQDGRYYAVASWPQPEATDNVGAVWHYSSGFKVYNDEELAALQADTSASPLPVVVAGDADAPDAWNFAPSKATDKPLKNGGVFPIEDGVITAVAYTISDAAGNSVQCSLTVAMKPTHISFYKMQASAVPRAPTDAAEDWVESTVLAHYQAFVSAEACAEKCHSIARTSAAAAAEDGVRTCNGFLSSRDGLNQCILLDLSGEGDRGQEFDFDANWDRYFLQAKSQLECPGLDDAESCLDRLQEDADFTAASTSNETADVAVNKGNIDRCISAVTAAYACVDTAFSTLGCEDEWVTKVIAARNDNDVRTCSGTVAPEVGQPAPLQTSCNSEDVFGTAEACTYECCDRDYSGAESRCTVLTNDGAIAEAGDARTVACMAEAAAIREQCTERCLRARPFAIAGGDQSIASSETGDDGNLHGVAALVDATAGPPPTGFVDVEVTLSFGHALEADWAAVESATHRAALIASCAEVYGMDSDRIGLAFSSAAGGASVVRVAERQPSSGANSVQSFGAASASKFNIASPEDAASVAAPIPFACAAIAGKSGDYLAILQTAEEGEATPCSQHASQLEDVARQCMPSTPTESYECRMNATVEGHDIITNAGTADCTARKDALVAALAKFAPGFPISMTCERADGKSVLRVADCADTAELLTALSSAAAAGGFAECRPQDTRSLAQAVFDAFQETVASSAGNNLHFPPLAAADHTESLVRRLSGRIPDEFDAGNGKGLLFAAMRMEWASDDIEEAQETTAAPAVYYDFDVLTEDGGNITRVDDGTAAGATDGTDADSLASNLDASTGGNTAADDDVESNVKSSLSSGVMAFAIIVPIFIIVISIYVVSQHKKHRKVHVVPTGLSFKQPAPIQSLPERGMPNYKDRTMQDVRSNALSSMPSTKGMEGDKFVPKRLSSAGTRLPPLPPKHDPFGAAKSKADGPDPFGDFN